MAGHPPSQMRALIQESKNGGRHINALLADARAIADPSFAAEALFELARHPSVTTKDALRTLDECLVLLKKVEKAWRRAEVIDQLARRGPRWRDGDDSVDEGLGKFQHGLVAMTLELKGEPLDTALASVAHWAPEATVPKLLEHALAHGSNPVEAAKSVLSLGPVPGEVEALERIPDPAVKARLLAYLHSHSPEPILARALVAAGTLADAEQVEVLRGIVASLELHEDLELVHQAMPQGAEPRTRLLLALAAQADRLGGAATAESWFNEAAELLPYVPEKARANLQRNLDAGRARLGGAAKPTAASQPGRVVTPAPTGKPAPESRRHFLALFDAYEGDLNQVQARAIARAAPLCVAFDLDLALVGFPVDAAADIVRNVSRDTGIGEGGRFLDQLAGDGRLLVVPDADALAQKADLVATMPDPAFAKTKSLEDAARMGRVAVLVGLGPKGLPARIREMAGTHYEITEQGISLETATAMGILADRLGRLKHP